MESTFGTNQGRQPVHLVDIYSDGLNRLRNSDLVVKKSTVFVGKMSAEN